MKDENENENQNKEFKEWLKANTDYSKNVIKDIACRVNRINKIIPFDSLNYKEYREELEGSNEFKSLSSSVKSQCRRALKLYLEFLESKNMSS